MATGTEQEIRFFTTSDNVRIAYSAIGSGVPIVRTPPWLSHLALEWRTPPIREFFAELARRHTVIRYDSQGCGLSDWNRKEFNLDGEVRILEALVDNLDIERFALFGYGAGGPVAVLYAARHPDRVSNLILFGTLGHSNDAFLGETLPDAFRAMMTDYWPLAARLLADLHAPEADGQILQLLANLYFQSSNGDNTMRAANGLLYDADVVDLLPRLQVPTTVIHRVNDIAMPYKAGRELAARIPNSCFVPLEGNSHVPFLGDTRAVLNAIARAMGDVVEHDSDHDKTAPSRGEFEHNGARDSGGIVADGAGLEGISAVRGGVAATIGKLRREGEYWTVSYAEQTFRLKDSRGLRYIAQLLRYPGREFHASELEVRSEAEGVPSANRETVPVSEQELSDAGLHSDGPGDAGEMLDTRAKAAYRRRLKELRDELDELKARGDAERAYEVEEELGFLTRELSRAVGLGGRDRRAGSMAQRSRINVTRAIRRTIEKIRQHSPALGGLLAVSIKTGITCAYRIGDRTSIAWDV